MKNSNKKIKMTEKKQEEKEKKKEAKEKTEKERKMITENKPIIEKKFRGKQVLIEPITTEKIVRQIELENKIAFIVNRKSTKKEIKKEIEDTFKSKVLSINTQIRNNKKIAFIKLKSETPAIDIATKLGIM